MTGVVVSNKMNKALVVAVISTKVNEKYNKRYHSKKRYSVTCSDSSKFHIGQEVEIAPCKPVSKTISYKVIEEVKK